ncbi:MAG: type II secretion system protein N [Gammaproteobacteria bacterium]|nr:type II secretion system protein N [Gammaproteobacteria bacterium]
MKKRYYILIAVLSYLFFTLGNVPAAKVISLIEKNSNIPVKLYGVYGSLWNGGAEKLLAQGQPPVDNLKWSINPAMLLLAQLNGEVNASIKNQNLIGNFNVSALGTVSASDVRARINAAVMQELIQMPLGELDGVFNINIEYLELKQQAIPLVKANLKWENAKITMLESVELGFVELSIISNDNDQLTANILNKKGQILIDGNADLDNKKTYNLNLRLTPDETASDNIRQSMAMFARRQTDGSYLLKRKGNLRDLGL